MGAVRDLRRFCQEVRVQGVRRPAVGSLGFTGLGLKSLGFRTAQDPIFQGSEVRGFGFRMDGWMQAGQQSGPGR